MKDIVSISSAARMKGKLKRRWPWDEIFTEVIGEPKITWAGAAQLSIESDAECWGVYDLSEGSICIQPTTSYLPGVVGDNYLEALFRFTEDD